MVQKKTLWQFGYGQHVSNIANISEKLLYSFCPYDWQDVCNIEDFWEDSPSLMTSFHMTNRE